MIFTMVNKSTKPLLNFHKYDEKVNEQRENYTNKILDAICDSQFMGRKLEFITYILNDLSLLCAKNEFTIKIPHTKTKEKFCNVPCAALSYRKLIIKQMKNEQTPVAYFTIKETLQVDIGKQEINKLLNRKKINHIKVKLGKTDAFMYLTRSEDKLIFDKIVLVA